MQSNPEFEKKFSSKRDTSPKRSDKKRESSRSQAYELPQIHEEADKKAIHNENPGDDKLSRQQTLVPLTAPLSHLHKSLGTGVVLYFHFIKYCIMLLVILFAISGLFNLISNVLHNGCKDHSLIQSEPCVPSYYQIFTIDNKRDDQTSINIQMVLNLLAVIACILFLQFVHFRFKKLQMMSQNYKITPSLYTLSVFGLDPHMTDSEIKNWVEGIAPNIECDGINRTYKLDGYFKLVKEGISKQAEKNKEHDHGNLLVLDHEQEKIEKEIKEYLRNKEPASFIYISMGTPEQAKTILKTFRKIPPKGIKNIILNLVKLCQKELNGKNVIIRRAPEPEDVLWLNQTYHPWENLIRMIIMTLLAGGIFVLCVFVVTFINLLDDKLTKDEDDDETNVPAVLLTFLQNIVIFVINFILGKVTSYLAEQEKHNSKTDFYVGIARKACTFTFVNTGLSFIIAQIILYANFNQSRKERAELKYAFFFDTFQNIFNVALLNIVLTPVSKICDPFYLIRLYKEKKAGNTEEEKKAGNTEEEKKAGNTEEEKKAGNTEEGKKAGNTEEGKKPHEYFEPPNLDFPLKYAFVLKSVLIASFFAPGMPIILIPAIIELIVFYWVDKYILLRRNRKAVHLSSGLNNEIFKYLKGMTIVFALGSILCTYSVKRLTNSIPVEMLVLAYLPFALGILHFILPSKATNEYLFRFHYKRPNEKAKNVKTYDSSNPFNSKANIPDTEVNMIQGGRQELKSNENEANPQMKMGENEVNIITDHHPYKNEKEAKSNDQELNNSVVVFKNLAIDLIKNPSKVRKTLNFVIFD